ncbi:hypothetical protein VTO73DRAFT_2367 [Trametes versicolor]
MGTGDVPIPMCLSYSAGAMREIATNAFAHADVDAKELRHESTAADRRILAIRGSYRNINDRNASEEGWTSPNISETPSGEASIIPKSCMKDGTNGRRMAGLPSVPRNPK